MSDRTPPKIALWLLQQCGSGYCAESLAGDLIEEYRRGRSVSWLWLQVATAVGLALLRFPRTMRWTGVFGASFRLAAEASAVLALVEIVDQNRQTPAAGELMHLWFIVIAAALINLATIGFLASTRALRRKPAHSLAGALTLALTLAFGVIALGVGSLTRADTARGSTQADSFGTGTAQRNASAPGGTDTARCNADAPGGGAENSVPESCASPSGDSPRGERRCPQWRQAPQ